MRQTLIIIYALLLIASCQTQSKRSDNKFQVLLPDTAKTHTDNRIFNGLLDFSKQMDLPRLDTGVNGIYLRLWVTSILKPDLLVTLSITDTIINAQKFDYSVSPDGVVHYKKSDRGFGGDSLQALATELEKIDFKNIISQSEIENFTDNIADGVNYNLEISTSKYYKLLSYHCPEHFANTEINNKKFLDIIFLLDRHLYFYSPICKY